jgi:hypothetical protein
MLRIAWMAVILLPVALILGEWLFGANGGDSSVNAETQRKAGLVIVRIAWMTAILIPLLIIAGVLFSGSDGGDSSRQPPKVGSAPPAAPAVGAKAQKAKPPAPQNGHRQLARGRAQGNSHLVSSAPPPSAPQTGGGGGNAPEVTPQPKPSPTPQPKPSPAPQPKPTPAPAPVQPTPSAPVQTTTVSNPGVANNNTNNP